MKDKDKQVFHHILHQINYCVRCYSVTIVVKLVVSVELYCQICAGHSVNSTDLIAQCSRFLFLSVQGPKISTVLPGKNSTYIIYLTFFAKIKTSIPTRSMKNSPDDSDQKYEKPMRECLLLSARAGERQLAQITSLSWQVGGGGGTWKACETTPGHRCRPQLWISHYTSFTNCPLNLSIVYTWTACAWTQTLCPCLRNCKIERENTWPSGPSVLQFNL